MSLKRSHNLQPHALSEKDKDGLKDMFLTKNLTMEINL